MDENFLISRNRRNNKQIKSSHPPFFNNIDNERFHSELYESVRKMAANKPSTIERPRPSNSHPPTIAIQHDYEDYYGGAPNLGHHHLPDNNGQLNRLFSSSRDETEINVAYTRKRYAMPNDPYWKDMWYLVNLLFV